MESPFPGWNSNNVRQDKANSAHVELHTYRSVIRRLFSSRAIPNRPGGVAKFYKQNAPAGTTSPFVFHK